MKVALLCAWPEGGRAQTGYDMHVVELARALAVRGVEVEVHTIGPAGAQGAPRVFALPRSTLPLGPTFLDAHALAASVRARGADVVHAQGSYPPYALAAWSLRREVPALLTVHGVARVEERLRANGNALRRIFFPALEGSFVAALPTIVVSPYLRDALGRPDATVIPNGVAPEWLTLRRVESPEPLLLASSVVERRKGLDTLLDALVLLRRERPALRLVHCGRVTEAATFARLREHAERVGLGAAVEWRGHVEAPALRELASRAWAFAFPSREETQGIALLEALAAGLPAVSSDIPGVTSWLGPDEGALFAPAQDAGAFAARLGALLDDAALRARLGEAGRRAASRFTWDAAASRHVELYRALAERRAASTEAAH